MGLSAIDWRLAFEAAGICRVLALSVARAGRIELRREWTYLPGRAFGADVRLALCIVVQVPQ
jgi:hypothetical protein